jgi:hypothetical protein
MIKKAALSYTNLLILYKDLSLFYPKTSKQRAQLSFPCSKERTRIPVISQRIALAKLKLAQRMAS